MRTGECVLEVRNINKFFGPTHANNDISLSFYRGEVRGIVGENGSGKSTLSSIFCGIQKADSGEMYKDGKLYTPKSPLDAIDNGISMVVQEIGVLSQLNIPLNIFIGREKQFSRFGIINTGKVKKAAQKELEKLGLGGLDVDDYAGDLSIEHRKMIELTRALMVVPDILILDEITQALSRDNRDRVYKVIRELTAKNKTVIVITHDIEEIVELADTITVLRDGQVVGTVDAHDITPDKVKSMMIGRDLTGTYYREATEETRGENVILSVKDLSMPGILDNVSFDLYEGEILAFCGLSDAGIHELGESIYRIAKKSHGTVMTPLAKKKVAETPIDIIRAGGAYLSKDRDVAGLMLQADIKTNISFPSIRDLAKRGVFVVPKDVKKKAQSAVDTFDIKCTGIQQPVMRLSGGNKQKVNLSRWLTRDLKFIILDCPTRGVDIGVKEYIYHVMADAKEKGIGIILITDELPEAIGMADRIIVMNNGKIAKSINRSEGFTEESIIEVMI
jgi:ribose transport system ATP-binding protein